jgi:hypothetical protein
MDNYPFLRPRLTPVQPRPAEDTIMNIPCRTVFYRTFDRVLAAFETVMTFQVAYGASVVLGTVLLQTSPERGLSGGQMEAFLRAMKDVMRFSPHSISKLKKINIYRSNATPKSSTYRRHISGN